MKESLDDAREELKRATFYKNVEQNMADLKVHMVTI